MKALFATSDKAGEMSVLVRRFEHAATRASRQEEVESETDPEPDPQGDEEDGADG